MPAKFILTADDFGPIDFINRGIIMLVELGAINSVHVLPNTDPEKLKTSLKELTTKMPGETLDIGAHLTLTSGAPLFKDHNVDPKDTWGKMIKIKNDGSYYFKDFKKFYFRYDDPKHNDKYINNIREELDLQIKTLQFLIDEVNLESEKKLKLTSVSNHHNIFTATEELFEIYVSLANKVGLAVRAPKVRPKIQPKLYYGLVIPLLNKHETKKHGEKMKDMNEAFSNRKYTGGKDITIQSTNYLDSDFYNATGTLTTRKVDEERIDAKVKDFKEMLERSNSEKDKIVEFVFHLGVGTEPINQKIVQGYSGVDKKYFDDRQVEYEALKKCYQSDKWEAVFHQMVSWADCEQITYVG